MRSRRFWVASLAAAVGLLLVIVTTGCAGEMEEAVDRALPTEPAAPTGSAVPTTTAAAPPQAGEGPVSSLSEAAEIGFTPVVTLHLPIAFQDWGPCVAPPTLIEPADGVNLATIAPLFRWDAGDDPWATQFRMRVSKDPAFEGWDRGLTSYAAQAEGAFRFHENLEPNTVYYWRAWLVCGDLVGLTSETWSFRTGADGFVPAAPALVTPESGATTAETSVTLTWEPVSRAAEYLVRYREAGEGWYRWVWTPDTQTTLNLGGGTPYEWWVAARNSYAVGLDSEVWRFTTPVTAAAAPESEGRGFVGEDGEVIIIERP